MSDFTMPSLGADMTAGTLLEWYVRPGDAVRRGDIVASVDTSKAEIEIEIFEDGVVGELLVEVGTRVPVGTPLATILPAAAGNGAAAATPAATPVAAAPPLASSPPTPRTVAPLPAPSPPAAPPLAVPVEGHRTRISPLARRVAAQLGIDPETVPGTGSGGAVTREDVERAATAGTTPPAPEPLVTAAAPAAPAAQPAAEPAPADRRSAMRKAIGDLMARSKREIPHYHLETAIDMTAALAWLAERNATLAPPERAIPAALLLAASARAAAKHPQLNGFFADGAPQPAEHVHLGVALALRGGGLVAPAIHDADRLPLGELMAALRDLTTRVRAGTMRGSEMADPTITVTSLGDRGADKVLGVIYPPQVALIGFGAIRERPWAAGGMVGARPTAIATLAADHRASDGHDGSLLLAELERLLQHPEELA
jgi:pyruvate dehydrogenase E2 component (dihydrolipoamide acetyltransferase)